MGKDLKGKELGSGLTQRKDGRYEGKYTDHNGKRKSIYGFKLSEVKQKLADIKYEESHSVYTEDITLNKFYEYWIENCKKDIVADNTFKNYRNQYIRHIKPIIGNMKIGDIKPIHCQEVLSKMYNDGFAYGTMVLTRVTMHAIFKSAVANDYIVKNPVNDNVQCKKRDKPDRRVLTVEEENEFIKFSKGTMYENAYRFTLQTGLRAGEVGGLKWSDINFENHTLSVKRTLLQDKSRGGFYFGVPKSKSSVREVPLTNEAESILLNQKWFKDLNRAKCNKKWNDCKDWEDLVFTTQTGSPVGVSTFNDMANAIVKKINQVRSFENRPIFERVTMHCFRHTFATRCFECGMKPKILQKILGHSTINVTMDMYVHVLDDEMYTEINKFESYKNRSKSMS